MNARRVTAAILLILIHWLFVGDAWAERAVHLAAEIGFDQAEAERVAGDVIPVTLYVNAAEGAALFGVEFEIAAPGALRIRSIEFNPAFSRVAGKPEPGLPASRFKTVRTQSPDRLDRMLGADGAPVPFATVEIEVLSALFAEADIQVTACGALLGEPPAKTTVFDPATSVDVGASGIGGPSNAAARGRAGRNRLKLVNTRFAATETSPDAHPGASPPGGPGGQGDPESPPEGDPDSGDAAPLGAPGESSSGESGTAEASGVPTPTTAIPGSLAIEIREPGGQTPVTQLVAGHQYELHYAASHTINDYVLFTVGAMPNEGFAEVHRPTTGPWANDGAYFAGILRSTDADANSVNGRPVPAPDYPTGMYRYDHVMDLANLIAGTPAPATGHLLTFIPESPGQLNLELYMNGRDAEQQAIVEMSTNVTLTVAAGD